jgi:hypothetical protein
MSQFQNSSKCANKVCRKLCLQWNWMPKKQSERWFFSILRLLDKAAGGRQPAEKTAQVYVRAALIGIG